MNALTVLQPYASLIAWGEKRYETRSWTTRHRGPLAIHAGVKQAREWNLVAHVERDLTRILEHHRIPVRTGLPYGAILCVVEVVGVVTTDEIRSQLSLQELAFGDYRAGRYAWELRVVDVFTTPVPARGRQGLWRWLASEPAT